jgi:hypothetical protein
VNDWQQCITFHHFIRQKLTSFSFFNYAGVAMVDLATGLFAHGAILAALHSRHQTGKGQKVDCSLMETQLACLVNIGQNWLLGATTEAKTWWVRWGGGMGGGVGGLKKL